MKRAWLEQEQRTEVDCKGMELVEHMRKAGWSYSLSAYVPETVEAEPKQNGWSHSSKYQEHSVAFVDGLNLEVCMIQQQAESFSGRRQLIQRQSAVWRGLAQLQQH